MCCIVPFFLELQDVSGCACYFFVLLFDFRSSEREVGVTRTPCQPYGGRNGVPQMLQLPLQKICGNFAGHLE